MRHDCNTMLIFATGICWMTTPSFSKLKEKGVFDTAKKSMRAVFLMVFQKRSAAR
mgnify:CR=1 FL=1